MLIEAVVVGAAPASDQVAWPNKCDLPPDEIAWASMMPLALLGDWSMKVSSVVMRCPRCR
ncbi:hypothetical protein [Streptomyces albidochromogenes]|uniref:hypothetical protein n=1 Tax=Streptomyces albidochromogenes TaxID=329524 RepID=UPI00110F86EA|nr:hypothetical protein [Streptomyces albidochromogenes]